MYKQQQQAPLPVELASAIAAARSELAPLWEKVQQEHARRRRRWNDERKRVTVHKHVHTLHVRSEATHAAVRPPNHLTVWPKLSLLEH